MRCLANVKASSVGSKVSMDEGLTTPLLLFLDNSTLQETLLHSFLKFVVFGEKVFLESLLSALYSLRDPTFA